MLKGICYNASRQERRKCSLWHAKSPGVATSGAFLFRCGKVAYALGWLPPIYLRPAICRCSRRLHLPRQRVRKTGLPKVPAAEKIDVDENGVISGLF